MEVLRRVIEQEFGPTAVVWPQMAGLTLADTCLLLGCERLRATFVMLGNGYPDGAALAAAVGALRPPLTVEERERADRLPELLADEPIPVTHAMAALPAALEGAPLAWALAHAGSQAVSGRPGQP